MGQFFKIRLKRCGVAMGIALIIAIALWAFERYRHPRGIWVGPSLPPGKVTPQIVILDDPQMAWLLAPDGSLWNWGERLGWQINPRVTPIPQRFAPDSRWTKLASGEGSILGLKDDGTLWTWGVTVRSGPFTVVIASAPVQVGKESNWTQMAACCCHYLALKNDGSLWAWGENDCGQVGDGTTNRRPSPTMIGTDHDWQKITASPKGSFAIKSKGTLWAWGALGGGSIGLEFGQSLMSLTPAHINDESNWVDIGAGTMGVWAIKADGTLWELGLLIYPLSTFEQIGSDKDWKEVGSIFDGELTPVGRKVDGSFWSYMIDRKLMQESVHRVTYGAAPWYYAKGGQTKLVLTKDGGLWTWGVRLGTEPSATRLRLEGLLDPVLNRWPSLDSTLFKHKVDATPYRLWQLPAEVRRSLRTAATNTTMNSPQTN